MARGFDLNILRLTLVAHTRLHLTAVLRKSLKECANGLSRCENVIDLIILSSSQIQGESSGLQCVCGVCVRVCVCVCVCVCLCLSHGFSVCVFLSIVFEVCFLSQYQKLLTLVYNGIFAKGISFLKAGADGKRKPVINLSETRIKAAVSEHSLGCWSCSGTFLHMSLWVCLTESIPPGPICTLPSYECLVQFINWREKVFSCSSLMKDQIKLTLCEV